MTERTILVLSDPADPGPLAGVLTEGRFQVVGDLRACLDRVRAGTDPVGLVVVDQGWPRPLAAARQLRAADAQLGLAVAAPAAEAESTRAKLAFLPETGSVAVVASDGPADQLRGALDELASATRQRQQLRGALDAINREIDGTGPPRRERVGAAVSERYLAALVRHAADTIVSVDAARRIVTINEAGQQTLGLERDEVEGGLLDEMLAADDPGRLPALLVAAEAGAAQVAHDLPVHLANGRRLLLSATAATIRDDAGALVGSVLIARDITAQRRADERLRALQKAEGLATLATGVAHDFNNLLVQIQGWAAVAAQDLADTELVSAAFDHIRVASDQAADLARAMLAYGGQGRFEPQRIDVGELVAGLRPLLAAIAPSKIRLELETTTGVVVEGDPTQLRQVMLNLVGNAVEAIGDDEGDVLIRTGVATVEPAATRHDGPGLAAGRYAVIDVTDTGPGIPPEHLDRLFDPFFTTKFTGRGLGLAASQGIARAHDGAITVDGRPGEGACFRVHLPTTS